MITSFSSDVLSMCSVHMGMKIAFACIDIPLPSMWLILFSCAAGAGRDSNIGLYALRQLYSTFRTIFTCLHL